MSRTSHYGVKAGPQAGVRGARAETSTACKQPVGAPAMRPVGHDDTDLSDVEAILRELEAHYLRSANPLYPMRAYDTARRAGIHPPNWCLAYIDASVGPILKRLDEYANGAPIGTEAVCVGKAMGFSAEGRGQGGWFQQATILERDRKIYLMIKEKIEVGIKLDAAYDEVAKKMNVSRSMVQRGYKRITNMIAEADDKR